MDLKNNDMISVIIPIFNREDYLKKCIESVLGQREVSTEIILVDDGSTDNSSAICDEYAKLYDNIIVIHQANEGLCSARNSGLDRAVGNYIFFVDSDDFLPDDSLVTLLKLQKQENADLVFGNYAKYSDDGEYEDTYVIPVKYCNKGISHREACELLLFSDKTHVLVVAWGKLFKRAVWEGLRFPENIPCSEDQFMFEKLMERCKKQYFTDKVVYNQIFSSNSIVRSEYSRNALYHSEGVYLVADYLVRKDYYDIALFKFGLGTRHLLFMKNVLHDEDSEKEIGRQYLMYKRIARKLFFHVDFRNKLRSLLFCVNLSLYDKVRSL
jgi:glycosyltransferase involved in cell wall biosynthesis